MKLWRRRNRHAHEWVRLGHGGAGWTLLQCATCGANEITA